MKSRIVRANEVSTKVAPADKFVGQVLQDQVFVPEDPSRLRVTRVTFTPGSCLPPDHTRNDDASSRF